jgi:hypothetical protein
MSKFLGDVGQTIERGARGARDWLIGKKFPEKPPDEVAKDVWSAQAESANLQDRALRDWGSYATTIKPEVEAQTEYQDYTKAIQQQRNDLQNRLRTLSAQQGISTPTTINQGISRSINRNTDDRISDLKANIPYRIAELRKQRAGVSANIGGKVMGTQNVPIDFFGTPASRRGGMLPEVSGAIGAGIGAFGGAGGAAAGYSIGRGLGTIGQGIANRKYSGQYY